MARCLIVGCGCRGRELTAALVSRGHAVRGTTRWPAAAARITDAGAEAYVGDPDRVATLAPAFEHVAVACLLLGSATGEPAQLAELHGSRLDMLLARMVDTTVRGIVYERTGSVASDVLGAGAERVRAVCRDARIPYAWIEADPGDPEVWLDAAVSGVETVLG